MSGREIIMVALLTVSMILHYAQIKIVEGWKKVSDDWKNLYFSLKEEIHK